MHLLPYEITHKALVLASTALDSRTFLQLRLVSRQWYQVVSRIYWKRVTVHIEKDQVQRAHSIAEHVDASGVRELVVRFSSRDSSYMEQKKRVFRTVLRMVENMRRLETVRVSFGTSTMEIAKHGVLMNEFFSSLPSIKHLYLMCESHIVYFQPPRICDTLLEQVKRWHLLTFDTAQVLGDQFLTFLPHLPSVQALTFPSGYTPGSNCAFKHIAHANLVQLKRLEIHQKYYRSSEDTYAALEDMARVCTSLEHFEIGKSRGTLILWQLLEALGNFPRLRHISINTCAVRMTLRPPHTAITLASVERFELNGLLLPFQMVDGLASLNWPSLQHMHIPTRFWSAQAVGSLLDHAPQLQGLSVQFQVADDKVQAYVDAVVRQTRPQLKHLRMRQLKSGTLIKGKRPQHLDALCQACPHARIYLISKGKQRVFSQSGGHAAVEVHEEAELEAPLTRAVRQCDPCCDFIENGLQCTLNKYETRYHAGKAFQFNEVAWYGATN